MVIYVDLERSSWQTLSERFLEIRGLARKQPLFAYVRCKATLVGEAQLLVLHADLEDNLYILSSGEMPPPSACQVDPGRSIALSVLDATNRSFSAGDV